jgi:hypothetical protein
MDKEPNYFTRTLIVIFCVCLATMVGYNFYVMPSAILKNGSLILIFIILILILSESFDSFSIGKIILISRKLKEKEKEVDKLEQKNSQLLNQLISVTNTQNQKQSSKQIFGDYYEKPKDQKKIDNEKNVQELLDRIGNSIVINEFEKQIIKELNDKDMELSTKVETVLVRHLAGTQLLLAFIKIDKYIFDSQLNLLRELASIAPEGFTSNEIKEYYENVKLDFPNSFNDWDYKKYLAYLFSSVLITKNGDKVHLTNFGQEFLDWISLNKADEIRGL